MDSGGSKNYLAFDLGAESGRAIIGRLRDGRLSLDVLHRFPNIPVRVSSGLHWDVLRLFQEMKDGLRAASADSRIDSIGLDTWGVDFALLDSSGSLLANPHHYRDSRTAAIVDQVYSVVPRDEIFRSTGIQLMPLNTLFQMCALKSANPRLLDAARTIVLIPDLFNYWFTGVAACEYTEATTSQMLDPRTGDWALDMLAMLGIDASKFAPIKKPGSRLGDLLPDIAEETGSARVPVTLPACHDTGCAVAAVPAEGPGFAYISSGTWSLVGAETAAPVINDLSLKYNFTNEGGVAETIRLLKNVMGLWIVQECRRQWEREGVSYDYARLTRMAADAPGFVSMVNPDHASFFEPGDMPGRIREFCRQTGQPVPEEPGAIVRAALDSLALKYRWVLDRLEELTEKAVREVHIVGGGSQNKLLNQLTADCAGRPVIAGPVEATAIGNVLVQAIGMGDLGSLDDVRQVVRDSFDLERFDPSPAAASQTIDAYGRFTNILESSESIL